MDDHQREKLGSIDLSPWIQKATALIGIPRIVGGNLFRHQFSVLAICIDYNFIDPILLKACIIHDLIEAYQDYDKRMLNELDYNGFEVVTLVEEVSRRVVNGIKEPKDEFLNRILKTGSIQARKLKVADRIDNITDLNSTFEKLFIKRYIYETIMFVIPMAQAVSDNMATELIESRLQLIKNQGKGKFF